MVIFTADAAGARRAAAGRFDGDGNALWNTEASVIELVVGLTLADAGDDGWTLFARVGGGAAQTVDPRRQPGSRLRLGYHQLELGWGLRLPYLNS